MRSVRGYLIALALALALLFCAAATVLLWQLERVSRANSEAQLLDTARALSLSSDALLQRYQGLLQALGQSEALAREDWPAFDAQARSLLSGQDAWIIVGDRSGQQRVNTRLPAGSRLPRRPYPAAIWPALDRGTSRICNLASGAIEKRILCVDSPVLRHGRAQYALSVIFRPALLQTLMTRQRADADRLVTLFDSHAHVIWRSAEPMHFLGKSARPEIVQAIARSSEGTLVGTTLDGRPALVAYARSPVSGWTTLAALPLDAAIDIRDVGLVGSVAALLLLGLAGAMLALFVAARLSAAIGQLSDVAVRIGAGEAPDFQASGLREIDAVGTVLERAIVDRDRNREHFELAEQVGDIGAWDWDIVNDQGHVSPSYKRMHGLAQISRPLRVAEVIATIHPDDVSGYLERLGAAKLRPEPSINEYRVVHGDGSVRWIWAKGRPLFDPHGTLIGAVGIVRDVTAERAADQALRESQARLSLAVEAAAIGIWDWDIDRDNLVHSERARAIYGLPAGYPRRVADVLARVHPDDAAALDAQIARALDPTIRESSSFEYRVLLADGDVRWVQANGHVVFDEASGTAKRYLGTVLDITGRKAAEATLEQLNRLLAVRVEEQTAERDRLWSLSRDPLVITDEDGVWVAASPAWTRILGWSEDELVGKGSDWLEHPDDHAATRERRDALARGEVIEQFKNRLRGRDGEYRWFAWNAVPEGGRFYAVARDITEEREQARALHTAEEALRQSQKMESIGQITGGLAHDFNNLLAPIVGTLDLLQQRGLPDARATRLVGGALEAAERARLLVQRLLAFARRQPLQRGPVDLARLLDALKGLLSSTVGPRVALSIDVDADLPQALADANQLELALLNLVVNARDALPDGGRIEISAAASEIGAGGHGAIPAGAYVRICVRDDGVGMAPTVVRRAIEPFFSTKGIGRGTGLGLSMVHGLTAQLGGGMTIDSELGKGTLICLYLPATTEQPEVAAIPEPAPLPAGEVRRALVVDDEALVRASTVQMLGALGYAVEEASSGARALELLEGGTFSLLVTDHLMPGMTGTELARAARARWPGLGVLIISGYADVDDIAPDLPRLGKPFRQKELGHAINGVVGQAASVDRVHGS